MNRFVIPSLAGCALLVVGVCGVALAAPKAERRAPIERHMVVHSITVATCAAGFNASPENINPMVKNGQHYTCTGPVIRCSPGFTAEASEYSQPGGGFNSIKGSPVKVSGGRMVYTCVEPPAPPR